MNMEAARRVAAEGHGLTGQDGGELYRVTSSDDVDNEYVCVVITTPSKMAWLLGRVGRDVINERWRGVV